MSNLYTVEEVANLLEVSTRRVRWLIFTRRLRARRQRGLGLVMERRDVADFVCENPEYEEALRDKFGWHISEYRRLREYHRTGIFPPRHICL